MKEVFVSCGRTLETEYNRNYNPQGKEKWRKEKHI